MFVLCAVEHSGGLGLSTGMGWGEAHFFYRKYGMKNKALC